MHRLAPDQRIKAYAELWPAHPRWGIWAWWAQRITGIFLVAYVVWHVVTIAGAPRDPQRFAALLRFLRHPAPFVVLLVSLAYHSANGVRLVLFDLGIDSMRGRRMFWGCLAVTCLIVAAGVLRGVLRAP
ncbi:MAG: hypothetical protein ACREJ4_14270 [Candidatus Methylomirabilaceae bacterium]